MRQSPTPYHTLPDKGIRVMFAPGRANGPPINAECEIRLALRARRASNVARKFACGHWQHRTVAAVPA
jgi:hypothetical protein